MTLKPILRWVGGKRRLIPKVAHLLPKTLDGTYYEPFIGGAALLTHLKPAKAVIGDACGSLLNVYRQLVVNREATVEAINHLRDLHDSGTPEEGSALFYATRKSFNEQLDGWSPLAAAQFVYLICKCFNGLCRFNGKGGFNAPLHKIGHTWRPIPSNEVLNELADYLQAHVIVPEAMDCKVWFSIYEPAMVAGDFLMVDPPYFPYWEQGFTGYSTGSAFTTEDQLWLRDTLERLWQRGVRIMAWNSAVPATADAYAKWQGDVVSVKQCVGVRLYDGKRKDRHEACMINYNPETEKVLPYEL
jgi:DNA adenine methylase